MQTEVLPPQNAGYMFAAYLIVTVVLVGYTVSLWKRVKKGLKT